MKLVAWGRKREEGEGDDDLTVESSEEEENAAFYICLDYVRLGYKLVLYESS